MVWEKSSYHSPTARKRGGTCTQTTSSAARRSSARACSAATGTASTTFEAPSTRPTWVAASAVEPVAMPSSTRIAVLPTSGSAPVAAIAERSTVQLRAFGGVDPRELLVGDSRRPDHLAVEHSDAELADRPHGVLGVRRNAELADHDHVQREPEVPGDLCCHRHAAAWQGEHDGVPLDPSVERRRQLLSGIAAVTEPHAHHLVRILLAAPPAM